MLAAQLEISIYYNTNDRYTEAERMHLLEQAMLLVQ